MFIPRPETESVVQLVIDRLQGRDGLAHPKVVDLGTGSGAIAGSIAHEVPGAEVHAVEFSEFAHAWAARNLLPLGVHLVRGDLRDALPEHNGTFDVVVSNPPYIPAEAIPNEPEVALHDPARGAVRRGADGMELPTAAAASAARLLVPGGYFVMEHAEVQAGLDRRDAGALRAVDRRWPPTATSTARTGPPAPSSPTRLPRRCTGTTHEVMKE